MLVLTLTLMRCRLVPHQPFQGQRLADRITQEVLIMGAVSIIPSIEHGIDGATGLTSSRLRHPDICLDRGLLCAEHLLVHEHLWAGHSGDAGSES